MNKTILYALIIAISGIINTSFSQTTAPEVSLDKVLLDISSPWGMAFINKDELLFTEKAGKVWKYNILTNTKQEITGLPAITQNGQGGLLDIALHPNFSQNNYVYLTYAVSGTGGQTTALGRGTLTNNQLQNFTEIFRALPLVNQGAHFGSRIAFDKDNFLFISVGDRGTPENAQNTNNHLGKIIRLKDDGTVPADNPFVGVANTKPEIYSYGHRNIQGMAVHPVTGQLYAHEHGPQGGDELNIIKKGANYGWPTITYGVPYGSSTGTISKDTVREGMEQPLTYWIPSIAPSGFVFVKNGQPANQADILIGALAGKHLHWLKMTDDKKTLATKSMQGYARFRDVEQAPDGKLYALTESPNQLILLKTNQAITSTESAEIAELNATIYPNPSSDDATLNLTLNQSQQVYIRIYTYAGVLAKPAISKELNAGKHEIKIDANGLEKGVYQVEITKGDRKSVLKWIKL